MNSPANTVKPLLIMGSKNYSSWSLRPWLFLRKTGFAFEERVIQFAAPDYLAQIAAVSPSRRVPLLVTGGHAIWDSLAICEFGADSTGRGLPANPWARGVARSIAAEMHSGFQALRDLCPMNVRARGLRVADTPELLRDIARIDEIWSTCRHQYGSGGGWLFGEFSLADAMFAPVCFRFQSYGAALSAQSTHYLAHVLNDTHMLVWQRAAFEEGHPLAYVDQVGKL